MAVGAQETQVLLFAVQGVAIHVVHVEHKGKPLPCSANATYGADVRSPDLEQCPP